MSIAAIDLFGPVVHSYTQAEAIEDGVLVPVTLLAKRHGLKVNTLITSTLLSALVGNDVAETFIDGDINPELSLLFLDIVQSVRMAYASQSEFTSSTLNFAGELQSYKACMTGDDQGKPCVVISMPEED